ncbi:GlsB/YeaQ/YmgE family stress response membrane protein [Taibaiella lutea]|uniref:GlsB/YeaQ/YmgE family stress response membrane protein n=1 Tax=Taibaiella lutea TaxID=2608001 RepID=A0A5M6CPQ3_9BACT|nr:GlsB/YeaQ/YmgE family stress response membrane protein [Taibaiella lutea]KAA5537067.1 GlsB/YeaQ/YmgE family stress response membrane protein [Taibaiella lutea]
MGILSWLIFGLIAGLLAKAIMPGKNPQGCLITIALGIVGAMVGGFIGVKIGWGTVNGFDLRSFGLAIGGALILLFIYQGFRSK